MVDGFPKTHNQAKELFDQEEMDDADQEGTVVKYNQLIMPGKKFR